MSNKIKLGLVGFGGRGRFLLKDVLLQMDDIEIIGVCDTYADRVEMAQKMIAEAWGYQPIYTTNYQDLIENSEIEAFIIMTAWESHISIAVAAMNAGKYVAMEVGGAYSIEDCWELVKTSERTKMPCMLLENCCYGRPELMSLRMAREEVLGTVVHCSGGYHHDLREEIAFGEEKRHYRLRNYLNRNCENYPTHELGPIAKILGLNRGNRMLSLVSVASKAEGMHEYIRNNPKADQSLLNTPFKQGDIVTTIIKCANGETIVLTLDTTLPRAYSRGFTVRGTKGFYHEDTKSVYIEGVHNHEEFSWKEQWGNEEQFFEQYDHPLWQEYMEEGIKSGHGGIDWLVFRAFLESVKNKTIPPIDVYDTALWMCVSELSEQSIALGGAPVPVPDFTSGRWFHREDKVEGKYSLDEY